MSDKIIKVTCKMCGTSHEVACKNKDYSAWKDGDGYIQDLMPYLTADQRELLISGNCGSCFDKMFPSGEDSNLEADELDEKISSEYEESDSDEESDFEDNSLDLTSREQNIMAEICSLLSSFIMDEDDDYARLGERIFLATDGCSSQFFGRLYDKFHRTGSNS